MPKRSPDYMRERRRLILDAATRCSIRNGWSRATIDDVAAAAGMSKGAVYVHFHSKDALLQGLLERGFEAIDSIRHCRSVEEFRLALGSELEVLNGALGRVLAIRQIELVLESTRDPQLKDVFRRATVRLIDNVSTVLRRLRPALGAAEARDAALTLTILLHGVRSLRAQSDKPSGIELRKVLERHMDALLQAS
jgi:AcrR family transcriptional regulator